MRILIIGTAACLALASCAAFNTKVVDPLLTSLAKIGATADADLAVADNVALAATPADNDGHMCIIAARTVGGQIKAVTTAANVPNAGALTTAELASLFQPGSAQYNQAQQTLVSGCAAKAQDVLGPAGLMAAGGVTAAIAAGRVLPILAAAP